MEKGKKKQRRKVLAILLTIAMIFGLIPLPSFQIATPVYAAEQELKVNNTVSGDVFSEENKEPLQEKQQYLIDLEVFISDQNVSSYKIQGIYLENPIEEKIPYLLVKELKNEEELTVHVNNSEASIFSENIEKLEEDNLHAVVEAEKKEIIVSYNELVIARLSYEVQPQIGSTSGNKIKVWDFSGVQEDSSLYENMISVEDMNKIDLSSDGKFLNGDTIVFGNLTLYKNEKDRIYSQKATNSAGDKTIVYDEEYTAEGYYYCNGTGGENRRCMELSDIKAGDKIIVYAGLSQGGSTNMHFKSSKQDDSVEVELNKWEAYSFVAKTDGTYKIYFEDKNSAKPVYSRIVYLPAVEVTGKIDTNHNEIKTDFSVIFTNTTTNETITAEILQDNTYSVKLAPDYSYIAALSGAPGFGFTSASNKVTVTKEDILLGKSDVDLVIEGKNICEVSGNIQGFSDDYLKKQDIIITLKPTESSLYDEVKLNIDTTDLSYNASIEQGVEYYAQVQGVNDYFIQTGDRFYFAEKTAVQNIDMGLKQRYVVSGNFIDMDYQQFLVSGLTKLTFTNMEDNYEYEAQIKEEAGYEILLREGTYKIAAEGSQYTTQTHVIVNQENVLKDCMFNYQKEVTPIPQGITDVYVGYPEKEVNYQTVTQAVSAVNKAAPKGEEERITIHIKPGTYREQIKITADYITLINEEPDKGEVILTWYYGIGHSYYSLDDTGFYNIEKAYDKFEKTACSKYWGATVYIAGSYFRAENIVFENSFNYYVTQEEVKDGAEGQVLRTEDMDVSTKAMTERAAAIVLGGNGSDSCDYSEFYQCSFLSSQDTVFVRRHAYFRNCFIEGNTDYIFGESNMTCVFDACELSFGGYSGSGSPAYITATRSSDNSYGTIFRNCVVTNKNGMIHSPSYFGRPWDEESRVLFYHTKLEDSNTINPVGWYSMSGRDPKNANYAEYQSISLDGIEIDFSQRTEGTVKGDSFIEGLEITNYFEGWKPYYYYDYHSILEEKEEIVFEKEPEIVAEKEWSEIAAGDILNVSYSLGKNENYDTSVIQWIRTKTDGSKEVAAGYSALQKDYSYKVTELDSGCTLSVVVKPETISGYTGEEKQASIIIGQVVDDTGLGKYNLEGYASADSENVGTTGGGIQTEASKAYYQVSTAEEFLNALTSVKATNVPSVIEITADLNLGSKEIKNIESYSTNIVKAYSNQPLTHPTLKETGTSIISIKDIKDLTIFSKNGSKILHANLDIKNSQNIIIRNLTFDELWEWDEGGYDHTGEYCEPGAYDRNDWDYMTIESESNNIWIDHCTFYKAYDGVIDIKSPSLNYNCNVTISWCSFLPGSDGTFFDDMMNEIKNHSENYSYYNHLINDYGMTEEQVYLYAYGQKKTHLLGQSDTATDAANLRVTFANNYYKNSMDRMPRLRFGKAHVYNCIMDAQDLYALRASIVHPEAAQKIVSNGASSTCGAELLVQNSYIIGITNALNSGNGSSPSGYINAKNTLYEINHQLTDLEVKCNTSKEGEEVLLLDTEKFLQNLPYGQNVVYYQPENLKTQVQPFVGAGVLDLTTTQWEKTWYEKVENPDTPEEPETPSEPETPNIKKRNKEYDIYTVQSNEVKVVVQPRGNWSRSSDGSWKFYQLDGSLITGWAKMGDKWYYLNPENNGIMETGWVKIGEEWYYTDLTDGSMKTGWIKENGKWYYLENSGVMATNWVQDQNKWYYLDAAGAMKNGWIKDGDKWYYLDESGVMQSGWVLSEGAWYFMEENGAMLANTQTPDGYFVDESGKYMEE